MNAMTPRDRVLAALHKRPTDRTPFTINETMLPQCSVERRLRNEGLCIIYRRVPVVKRTFRTCVVEEHAYTEDGKPRKRRIVRTPVGDVYSVAEPAGFTAWTIERLFKGPEDYQTLLYMVNDEQFSPNYGPFAEFQQRMGDDVLLRARVGACPLHALMIQWMGVERFAVEWAERQDEVLTLEQAMRARIREIFPVVAGSPATHANFGGNETPEAMGPKRYREFCIPLFDECAELLHEKGKLLGSHLDANNGAWAADLATCKLDYIEAFTPAPDTDMTLEDALRAWPDKVLWINFPSSVHLASVSKIKQTAHDLIDAAAGTNRLILGITEDMPEDRWQENLLAISEAINEHAATTMI